MAWRGLALIATVIDLHLVAEIVRLAGLQCQVEHHPVALLRARPAGNRSGSWTVAAGSCQNADATFLAFVGPAHAKRTRLLRTADERQLAALIVLQALRDNPDEPISHEEAAACGLSDGLIWA